MYFENYFIYGIEEEDISESTIDKLINTITKTELRLEISKISQENKTNILIEKLRFRLPRLSIDELKKFIYVLLNINYSIYNASNTLIIAMFKQLNQLNKKESNNFILELCEEKTFNYSLLDFIYRLYHDESNKLFTDEEFNQIIKKYFTNTKFDTQILLNNKYKFNIFLSIKILNQKTFKILMDEIRKDDNKLLKYLENCGENEEYISLFEGRLIKNSVLRIKKRDDLDDDKKNIIKDYESLNIN